MPIAENHILISRAVFDEGMLAVENKEYKRSFFFFSKCLYIIANFHSLNLSILPNHTIVVFPFLISTFNITFLFSYTLPSIIFRINRTDSFANPSMGCTTAVI